MGHWAEGLVDDLAQMVGGDPGRALLAELAVIAACEIEVLSGRSFHEARRTTSQFVPNDLPLLDVPDLLVGSIEGDSDVWAIPDPVDPAHALVLQLVPLTPMRKAAPVADALWVAGQLVADASRVGALSADFVVHWLGTSTTPEEREGLFRRIMDPAVRFHIPVLRAAFNGWWFQIARRLVWVTSGIEDEGRLLEPLFDPELTGGELFPLAATEPMLTVARVTQQPVDWAMPARIWPEGVERLADRRWSTVAGAVHGHGIPTISVDPKSTAQEIACQVILKGYWHGYIGGDEPALAWAIEAAYPKPVERIRSGTRADSSAMAAAILLERLLHPGFDPAQGAEANRRYVRRKANIVVMEHRKQENPGRYPWTQVGISERRFYKLLPQFAEKLNGRYDYDHDDVVARMKAYLNSADRDRDVRAAALDVLQSHGFQEAAARKWLQRHTPAEAVDAWPRGRRPATVPSEH